MHLLPTLALLALTGSPPLAREPAVAVEQAANPMQWADVPRFDLRRLRFSGGLSLLHTPLRNPGGNAVGPSISVALEGDSGEAGLAVFAHAASPSEDRQGRNTGLASTQVRAFYRFVPFPGSTRVSLATGVQLGHRGGWAYCVRGAEDACGYAPSTLTYAAVLGSTVGWKVGAISVSFGLDLLLEGPRPPTPVRAGLLGVHGALEVGYGGLPW